MFVFVLSDTRTKRMKLSLIVVKNKGSVDATFSEEMASKVISVIAFSQ